jgi:predicted dehydrogenase
LGFDGVAVTHAWTQDEAETECLCAAAQIPNAVDDRETLLDEVDAVVVARDDYETHLDMALPFLERGVPTFVDKPLAVDPGELATFQPYLEEGLCMSCSGMYFARELDEPRANLDSYGTVELVSGTIIKNWSKYGVHLLDAIFGVLDERPETVTATETATGQTAATITTTGDVTVRIDTIGDAPITFDVDVYGSERVTHHRLRDNFHAFRRTLWHFFEMARTSEPQIPTAHTLDVLRTVVAGRRSLETGERVRLEEVSV